MMIQSTESEILEGKDDELRRLYKTIIEYN